MFLYSWRMVSTEDSQGLMERRLITVEWTWEWALEWDLTWALSQAGINLDFELRICMTSETEEWAFDRSLGQHFGVSHERATTSISTCLVWTQYQFAAERIWCLLLVRFAQMRKREHGVWKALETCTTRDMQRNEGEKKQVRSGWEERREKQKERSEKWEEKSEERRKRWKTVVMRA